MKRSHPTGQCEVLPIVKVVGPYHNRSARLKPVRPRELPPTDEGVGQFGCVSPESPAFPDRNFPDWSNRQNVRSILSAQLVFGNRPGNLGSPERRILNELGKGICRDDAEAFAEAALQLGLQSVV